STTNSLNFPESGWWGRILSAMKGLISIVIGLLVGSASAAEIDPKVPVKLSEPRLFSFAQLCDTQLGMGDYEHDVKTPDEKENYYNIPSAKRMELLKLHEFRSEKAIS
ncbi:MAG: hypothetical protein OSB65_19000, partial [Roseibacillus sp.]|nr:hypothetical protein [Roseibacillus sp.]